MALEGKMIVVTGTASGIGKAIAERLAQDGAQVLCADIDADGAEATSQGINAAGGVAW